MASLARQRRMRIGTRVGVAWFVFSVLLLIWPIYPWLGDHVHPRIFGLPWSLTWVLLVIFANFVALLVLYRLRVVDDRELEPAEQASQESRP